MTTHGELRLNAFQMASPGHTWAGLWRHPRDTGSAYNSLDYWVDLARTAERGLFDGIFLADVLGQYDVYGCVRNVLPIGREGLDLRPLHSDGKRTRPA